jgi:hypothetical protein
VKPDSRHFPVFSLSIRDLRPETSSLQTTPTAMLYSESKPKR